MYHTFIFKTNKKLLIFAPRQTQSDHESNPTASELTPNISGAKKSSNIAHQVKETL